MISSFMTDYAAPIVVAATLGAVSTFGIDHSERISSLESNRETSFDVQRELVQKVDNLTNLVIRIDSKLEERERNEQRQYERSGAASWEVDPLLQPEARHYLKAARTSG